MPAVLVDTGLRVALLDRSDPYHLSCQETFSSLDDSLVTIWPIVTEAIYLLRAYWQAQDALWEMIESGAVQVLPLGTDDIPRMRELMRKYRDLPMDLADAGLVRVAEREPAAPHFHVGPTRLSNLSPIPNRPLRHPSEPVTTLLQSFDVSRISRNTEVRVCR